MFDYDPAFDTAQESLAALIGGLGSGVHDAAEWIQGGIEAQIHQAAVGLLGSVLQPIVHGQNLSIRSSSWVALETHTLEVGGLGAGVSVGNAVLAGLVRKKVDAGVGTIMSDLDYAHGVSSIT